MAICWRCKSHFLSKDGNYDDEGNELERTCPKCEKYLASKKSESGFEPGCLYAIGGLALIMLLLKGCEHLEKELEKMDSLANTLLVFFTIAIIGIVLYIREKL